MKLKKINLTIRNNQHNITNNNYCKFRSLKGEKSLFKKQNNDENISKFANNHSFDDYGCFRRQKIIINNQRPIKMNKLEITLDDQSQLSKQKQLKYSRNVQSQNNNRLKFKKNRVKIWDGKQVYYLEKKFDYKDKNREKSSTKITLESDQMPNYTDRITQVPNFQKQNYQTHRGKNSLFLINPYTRGEYLYFKKQNQYESRAMSRFYENSNFLTNMIKPCKIQALSLINRRRQKKVRQKRMHQQYHDKESRSKKLHQRNLQLIQNQKQQQLKPWQDIQSNINDPLY